MNVRNRRAYIRVMLTPAWPPDGVPMKTDYAVSDYMAYALLEGKARCELVFVETAPREHAEPLQVKLPEEVTNGS